MLLMTQEIAKQIPPLYSTEDVPLDQKMAVVKYFDPTGSWTWYVVEGEKDENNRDWLFFGLVDGFEKELGYFTLSDLQNAKQGQTGLAALPIERDLHWQPKPLSELMGRG